MKKTVVIILSLLIYVSVGFTEEAVNQTANQAKVRAMINAGVSAGDAENISVLMQKHHVGSAHREAAFQVMIDTAQKGLPIRPVINKVFEGLAKKAPGPAIVQAMQKTCSRYEFAYRKTMDISRNKRQTKRLGNTIAEALAAGLRTEDIDRILDSVRERIRDHKNKENKSLPEEAFNTARTMARLGVDSSKTAEVVCRALQNNFSAKEMKIMHGRFVKQTQNISAEKAADQYSKSLTRGMKAVNLRRASDNKGGSKSNKGNGNDGSRGNNSNGNGGSGRGSLK